MPLAKVLVVSDDAPLRALVQRSLETAPGTTVVPAAGPAEACELAAVHHPDAVLLDGVAARLYPSTLVAELAALKLRVTPIVLLVRGDGPELPAGIAARLPAPADPARFAAQVAETFTEARFQQAFKNLDGLGGEEFVHEMIDLFINVGTEKVTEARACLDAGDLTTAGRDVHSLKSSAANLGADVLSDLARQAEVLARQEDVAGVAKLLPLIEEAFAVARARLERRKATGR